MLIDAILSAAPVQHLLEYRPVLYGNGFNDQVSIYQGDPSPEVDEAWEDLYNSKQPTVLTRLLPFQ